MTLIRPEARAALIRWREVGAAGLALASGLWLVVLGGYLLIPMGVALVILAAFWAIFALRRLRFGQGGGAPGVIEVDEGQIAYFGPETGGAVSLREMAMIRVMEQGGRRFWHLRQGDGQSLAIPFAASGAEALFDALATLPGLDTAALVAAVEDRGQPGLALAGGPARLGPPIWQRPAELRLR